MNKTNPVTERKYPLGDEIGSVEVISRHENPLLSVVNAARVSYNREKQETDEKDHKLAQFLWNNSHSSPFRHNFYTIKIKAPLFVMRQWWKHQIGAPWLVAETADGDPVDVDLYSIEMDTDGAPSWNEMSGRYVAFADEYYLPQRVRSNAGHANKQASSDVNWSDVQHGEARTFFQKATSAAFTNYRKALDMGYAKEMARMLLPQNVYSSAVWTPSLQALVHFLSLRLKEDAQWEIRQYALAINDLISQDLEDLGICFL